MRKSLFVTLATAALVCVFVLPALYAVEAPGDLTLSVPEGGTATQAPVDFSHAAHGSFDCEACHHKWDGSSEVQPCSAEGCHTDLEDKRGDASFYKAFHDRMSETSCTGCHTAKKKAGEATGPTACTDCHPK